MKSWRAERAKWPLETAKIVDPASLPAWANTEPAQPSAELDRKTVRTVGAALAVGASPFPIALGAAFLFLPLSDPIPFARFVFAGLLGGVGGIFFIARWSTERLAHDRRSEAIERLEARGETTLGGEFVGIAYTEGYWQHPRRGDDFDEGILRIDFDRLTFVGRDTCFELPASAVVRTEIRHNRLGQSGDRYCLYVHWTDPNDGGVFSVALPYRTSARRRVTEALDLQERIDAWRGERRSAFGRERPFLAPPSIKDPKPGPPIVWEVGNRAKGLAALAAISINAVVFFMVGFLDSGDRIERFLIPLSFSLWVVLASIIEKRLPERHRYQAPAPVVPATDLGLARVEDETAVQQQA